MAGRQVKLPAPSELHVFLLRSSSEVIGQMWDDKKHSDKEF